MSPTWGNGRWQRHNLQGLCLTRMSKGQCRRLQFKNWVFDSIRHCSSQLPSSLLLEDTWQNQLGGRGRIDSGLQFKQIHSITARKAWQDDLKAGWSAFREQSEQEMSTSGFASGDLLPPVRFHLPKDSQPSQTALSGKGCGSKHLAMGYISHPNDNSH